MSEWLKALAREYEQGWMFGDRNESESASAYVKRRVRHGECSHAWACGAIDALLLRVTA